MVDSKQQDFVLPNPQEMPRFSGIRSFMRLPYNPEISKKDFVILGAPFDTATTYRSGTRFGPEAIRRSSVLLRAANVYHNIRPSDYITGVDGGDVMVIPGNTKRSHQQITEHVQAWAKEGAVPIILGGDHSISLPNLRAVSSVHGPLSLVHFDAHGDTWDEYWEEKYTHGSPFRRAMEEGLIDPSTSIQIGMRGTVYDPNDINEARELGFQVITSDEVREFGLEEVMRLVKDRVGTKHVYLTFDIDFLDPAFAPGTGTPEIAGFSSAEAQSMLRELVGLNFVGFDLVEVLPALDPTEVTALTAATIVFEFISLLAISKREKQVEC